MNMEMTSYVYPTITEEIFDKNQLNNKSTSSIETYFSTYSYIDNVEISISPFWAFRSPLLVERINISVNDSNE